MLTSGFKRRLFNGTAIGGAAVSIALLSGGAAHAGPEGFQRVLGQFNGGPNTNGSVTEITQTTQTGLIQWTGGFNIDDGETVIFYQPDTAAVTVNHDISGVLSNIDGNLNSCLATCADVGGNVWIINPSGVTFGPNAVVNVGGLLATTSEVDVNDLRANFRVGTVQFDGNSPGEVAVLSGAQITGQDSVLAFIAPTVRLSLIHI